MVKNNARTLCLVMSMVLTPILSAGTVSSPCNVANVSVPCLAATWEIGVAALDVNPTIAGDMTYLEPYQKLPGVDHYNNRGNQWRFGFEVEGFYRYRTGNDAHFTWYHLNTTLHKPFLSSTFDTQNTLQTAKNTLSTSPAWDQLNLEFGQTLNFTALNDTRLHTGFEFARLKASGVNNASWYDSGALGITNSQEQWHKSYYGFGVRGGMDVSHTFHSGLRVYATSAASLLFGNTKFNGTLLANQAGEKYYFVSSCWNGTKERVVPGLEAKLGALYTWALSYGDITVDLGYLWFNYFKPFDGAHESNTITPDFQHQRLNKRGVNDFAIDGLYFGLKWLETVA